MKAVKEKLKADGASDGAIKEFDTGKNAYGKKIMGSFQNYKFLTGERMKLDGT